MGEQTEAKALAELLQVIMSIPGKKRLTMLMEDGKAGVVTVRQFLDTLVEEEDGQPSSAQRVNVYGFTLIGGGWAAIPADRLRDAYTSCSRCGAPLDPEPDVSYCCIEHKRKGGL